MKKNLLFLLLLIGMGFSSCKKTDQDEPKTPEKMEELTVPASFNWKTTKDFSLTLNANASGIAEVNNTSGISYQKAYLSPGQAYTMNLTVPSYEKSVIVKFNGVQKTIELTTEVLTVQF